MTDEHMDTIQAMMDSTWHSCFVGGGSDGNGMSHKNQKVIRVLRIEHPALWKMYAARRDMIKPRHLYKASEKPPRQLVASLHDDKSQRLGSELGLDASRNEVLLFTGTSHGQVTTDGRGTLFDAVSIIQKDRFDERVASVKGMFGAAQ